MPAEALLDLIDKHPEKDRIFLSMVNRYLAINVTLNGKVFGWWNFLSLFPFLE